MISLRLFVFVLLLAVPAAVTPGLVAQEQPQPPADTNYSCYVVGTSWISP